MITSALIAFVAIIINIIFAILPDIPSMPDSLAESIYNYFNLIIQNGFSILSFFINPRTIIILVPLAIIIHNAEYIYKFVLWILRKIPLINIK